MVGELIHTGVATCAAGSAAVVLRAVVQVFVAVWSLRADAAGRRHALRLIDALRIRPGKPGRRS